MTVTTPSAPPLRATAPAVAAGSTAQVPPVPHIQPLDINGIALAIANTADPAALLTHLLLLVSSHSATAPEQGALLSKVSEGLADMTKRVRGALLTSVGETPGTYNGFEIVARSGSRRVDYDRLQGEYPEVFGDVVTVGSPTLVVRYTGAAS